MPPTLHPHLKRGLDFDGFHIHPEDAVEELPTQSQNREQRAAKRRRVEAIASRYLHGRAPLILTAGLRGPFNTGWKNPWANTTAASRSKMEEVANDIPVPEIASPEASRAPHDDDLDSHEPDDSLNDIEVPPPTAPLPDEDDISSATEYFSATTEKRIQKQSPLADPFWLRRSESARVDMRKATNGNTDVSPTRSRSRNGDSQSSMVADLRLRPPQGPTPAQSSPRRIPGPHISGSSASAPMDIPWPAISADRARNEQPRRSSRNSSQNASIPTAPRPACIASPVPASSNGFVNKKMEESKSKPSGEHPSKLKPRFVNFSSSPAPKKKSTTTIEKSPQNMDTNREAADDTPGGESTDAEEIMQVHEADATDMPVVNKEMRVSRGSDWSTQAAMALAQLEFQQSTFPAISQPSQDTPRSMLIVPSPAVTPLSVFHAQQDKSLLDQSVLQGPPISTQDLFGAASPFAFSTVKKKPGKSVGSNLRLALNPSDPGDSRDNDATAKSPTRCADRIPLKDKNTTTSFWSFITDKASQGSQGSLCDRSRPSMNDVELPQLDLHTSLDGLGPTGDLHFTDRFLRDIDGT
ncbi:hypothetical protein BDW02DRAFT_173753 [Decorospora gaudefroyi]|uniref:Uncharacterized protein n=1 Tax=Decorospora gaudefroyi TaxID=184978 RepID=A0A6A5KNA5_9PLEO|nr:hypothetical protein BDW02DRAFT_173753 [Decorospora gaudefroyi]